MIWRIQATYENDTLFTTFIHPAHVIDVLRVPPNKWYHR